MVWVIGLRLAMPPSEFNFTSNNNSASTIALFQINGTVLYQAMIGLLHLTKIKVKKKNL